MAEFKISRFRYTWKGNWSSTTLYIKDDIVKFAGQSWVCIRQHTSGTFASDQSYIPEGNTSALPAWTKMTDGYNWKGAWTYQTSGSPTLYSPGDVVSAGGELYLCTISHSASALFSSNADKWTVYTSGYNFRTDWTASTRYLVGDTVRYNGIVYRCVSEHVSSTITNGLERGNLDAQEDSNLELWQVINEGTEWVGDWTTSYRYRQGDLVLNNGSVWKCREGHTSSSDSTVNFDPEEHWDLDVPGYKQTEWNNASMFVPGDVVQYGGYIYTCLLTNRNSAPGESIYQTADRANPAADWAIISKGINLAGEWTATTQYKTGDVIRRGGHTYVALLDTNFDGSTLNYLDSSNWELVTEGFAFRAEWAVDSDYAVGDLVVFEGTTYKCSLEHLSTNQNYPGDNGNGIDYWSILIASGANVGMSNQGDLLTFDLSRTLAGDGSTVNETAVPIGSEDQLLSVDTDGSVYWKTWGNIEHLVYVRPNGIDDITDPERGKNYFKPWKTVNYACRQIEQQGLNSIPVKVKVLPGRYEEVLPIIVPALTAIQGDEVRGSTIVANPPFAAYASDTEKILAVLSRFSTIMVQLLEGTTVTRTTGNTELQAQPRQTAGLGAQVGVSVSNGIYTSVVPSSIIFGSGYVIGDLVKVLGGSLGGTTPENDLVLRVSSVDSLGGLTGATIVSGTGSGTQTYAGVYVQPVLRAGNSTVATVVINLMDDISDYINFFVNSQGVEPSVVGINTANTNVLYGYSTEILEDNKNFLAAEAAAYVRILYPTYVFDDDRLKADIVRFIDAWNYDLIYTGNYKSLLSARYYKNSVLGSSSEDMFYVRDATGVRNLTIAGLEGSLNPPATFELYQRPTGGAYVSLDPGWGPADNRTWITTRSPYIQNVATQGFGCIGQKIDGLLHNGGNRSIVSNDFTQLISDGIGAWVLNGGRAELVSVFTYYSQIGYFAEAGGIIRATNGNNSYGKFGAIADGNDPTEVPYYGYVNARANQAVVSTAFSGDFSDVIFLLEYTNCGQNYTQASLTFTGSGANALVYQEDFRDNAITTIRGVAPVDSTNTGGSGFTSITNNAQTGDTSTIRLAAETTNTSAELVGCRIIITSGDGTGQYGQIFAYNSGTKVATIYTESTNILGWDHILPGTPLATTLSTNSTYRIEPRPYFSLPPFTTAPVTFESVGTYISGVYGETTITYANVSGSVGTGTVIGDDGLVPVTATWNITKRGRKYEVSIAQAGAGYQSGQTVVIEGEDIGGVTGEHDITIRINSTTEDSTNSIGEFDYSGIGRSGVFVALPTSGTAPLYSYDGTTWNQGNPLPTGGNWISCASGISSTTNNNTFVAIQTTSNKAVYSTNGITWTETTLPSSSNWRSVAFGNGIFVAVADNLNIGAFTKDGITWTATTLPTFGDSTYNDWSSITYGAGRFVAISDSANVAAHGVYTNSGAGSITWVATVMDAVADSSKKTWVSAAYGNNRYVAISNTGDVGFSFDGESWTGASLPKPDGSSIVNWKQVKYAQGVFFAICDSGDKIISGDYAAGSITAYMATSPDGIVWTGRSLPFEDKWKFAMFGNPDTLLGDSTLTNSQPQWIVVPEGATTQFAKVQTGAQAQGRIISVDGVINEIRIWDPGSGYTEAPTLSIFDPSQSGEPSIVILMADGVLAQPSWSNRGIGYRTASTFVSIDGDGFADILPVGRFITLTDLSVLPGPGAQLRFAGRTDYYTAVRSILDNENGDGTVNVTFQISPEATLGDDFQHGTEVEIREKYSQCRITGHDFLDIGTGNAIDTNYPTLYTSNFFSTSPENEIFESDGGRVFYTSTDQSGNFRTGELFSVEQATGIVTISADFFDLQGLTELALGGVRLGGTGTVVREFSTDPLFLADSNNVVPTQRAVKAYLASRLNIGGADLLTSNFIAGIVSVGPATIQSNTGAPLVVNSPAIFSGTAGITGIRGAILAQTMFFKSFKDDGQRGF
jgi:hypothetical protein